MPKIEIDVPEEVLSEFEASLEKVEVDKAGSGIMVAWFPPKGMPEYILGDKKNTEDPDELHVTIAYFGDKDSLDKKQLESLRQVLRATTDKQAPLSGQLAGTARFPANPSTDGKDVVVMLADVPYLESLRERFLQTLSGMGIEAKRNHGYTPHMTLQYLEPGVSGADFDGESIPVMVDALTLAIGGKREVFPLAGITKKVSAFEDFFPLVEKRQSDAPRYRQSENTDQVCSKCIHGGDGYCDLYSFNYNSGWVCDSWEPMEPRYEKWTPPVKLQTRVREALGQYKDQISEETALLAGKLQNGAPISQSELEYLNTRLAPEEVENAEWYSLGGRAGWSWARRVLYQITRKNDIVLTGTISKVDDEQQLVFGWASVSEEAGKTVTDRQGDEISEQDMEQMAYKFVKDARNMGVMHDKIGDGVLVESIAFTKEKQKALGIDLGKVAWWIGYHVTDKNVWKRIKSGELQAFSIHGKGRREKIAD